MTQPPPQPPSVRVTNTDAPAPGYRDPAPRAPASAELVLRRATKSNAVALVFFLLWSAPVLYLLATDRMARLIPHATLLSCMGLFLAFFALGALLNRVTVRIDPDSLRAKERPLTLGDIAPVPTAELERIVGKLVTRHSKHGTIMTWWVLAVDNDGEERRVVSPRTREEAEYIAWVLDDWLRRHRGG